MIMAYGNYAPFYRGGYFNPMQTQPQMPMMAESQAQQYVPPYQAQQPILSDVLWVLNEGEATAFPVAPNNSVVLWDKSNPTIYVKSVNAQGVPSMRVLDFVERTQQPQTAPQTRTEHVCQCGDKFVTKEMFNALQSDFEALQSKLEALTDKMSDRMSEKPRVKTARVKSEEE